MRSRIANRRSATRACRRGADQRPAPIGTTERLGLALETRDQRVERLLEARETVDEQLVRDVLEIDADLRELLHDTLCFAEIAIDRALDDCRGP